MECKQLSASPDVSHTSSLRRGVINGVAGTLCAISSLISPHKSVAESGQNTITAETRCDRIEFNTMYNPQGNVIFHQLIFWQYHPGLQQDVVVDFRLLPRTDCTEQRPVQVRHISIEELNGIRCGVERMRTEERDFIMGAITEKGMSMLPYKNPNASEYVVHLLDDDLVPRKVSAPSYSRSHTQEDPECQNREILPKEKRTGLSPSPAKIWSTVQR